MQDPFNIRKSVEFPLVIKRGLEYFELGKLSFQKKSKSLVYSSVFHNGLPESDISLGNSTLNGRDFRFHKEDVVVKTGNGYHISLHPNYGMHFRQNSNGTILEKRLIEWYPVAESFNLLIFYTLPIRQCPITNKNKTILYELPENFCNSLMFKIDVYPKDSNLTINSNQIVGYCPDYLILITLIPLEFDTQAILLWPKGDSLTL